MNYLLAVYLPVLIAGPLFLAQSIAQGYWPLVTGGWFLVCGLGVATGYHRVYAHKTHRPKPWLDLLLLACGVMAGIGSSIRWCSIHLDDHHEQPDTVADVYSPENGIFNSLLGWMFLQRSGRSVKIDHLWQNPRHRFVHRYYATLFFVWLLLCAGVSIFTPVKFFQAYVAVLFLSFMQESAVNVLCHKRRFGYRNTQTDDNSVNVWLLGYLGWGQGWHNSHHAHPDTFVFSDKWWEYDPCSMFLHLLEWGSHQDQTPKDQQPDQSIQAQAPHSLSY